MIQKKQYGQNFIDDTFLIEDIVNFSEINKDDYVVEIGPGVGSLTEELLNRCKQLVSIEIDKALIPILEKKFYNNKNFYLLNEDILNTTNEFLYNIFIKLGLKNDQKVKSVSNIPYYITSPIIMKLLSFDFIKEITIMVQKEVADRIISKPNNKNYGVLTLIIEYYADCVEGFVVDKKFFNPIPKVDSKIIKIVKKNKYNFDETFENKLFNIIKKSFLHRRKILMNSLVMSGYDKKILNDAFNNLNLDNNIRAENLSLDQYIELAKIIN